MRRHHLLLIVGVCALLLTPTADGGPAVPGDPTPPVVTPHIFGTLGLNGWYVSNVTVNWTVEDPESQILETQGCNAITLVNDTTGTPLTCYARSDGGETTVTITIRLDKTAPTVTATPARNPDSNGWYNHALSVGFSGTDATSGIDSCVPPQTYSGPDSANASVSGSCRDHAGNTGTRTFSLSYDATAPQVTGANASRGPDHAGWYNHTLSISFTGADATSGIDTCTQTTYSGPDDATASVNGTCRDRAGNTSAPGTFNFQYDETGPNVTATPSRAPDLNGWYNHTLTVSFNGTDATSGLESCVPAVSYSGPDSANASVSGTCTDHAGNTGARSFGFSYDDTVPQVTSATPSRSPDHGGWYNHTFSITFAGTDATSGVDTCTQATYSGPDDATASVSGTCRDRAGNTSAPFPFNFRYDETAPTVTATPSRNPDSNGWYNHPLSVGFAGSDAISGIESCVPAQTYSGPDSANASVSGSCQDHAGNTTSQTFALSYDATGPVVTATPSRAPDSNGWYNHVLTVTFSGTDPMSGLDSCVPPQSYSGPDDATASVNGTCRDRAGNTTARAFALSYDATGPAVTASPARAPDSQGWYNHALRVTFSGSDATSGVDSCVPPQTYSGPDDADAAVLGSCVDHAGNMGVHSFALRYDATAPQVTGASASRGPDHGGWYNHTLTVSFTGADATSGIDSCTETAYSGPDSVNASVTGTCRDRAGNTSAAGAFGFQYDETGPVVTPTAARDPDSNGWYNHALSVSFAGTDATSGLDSCVPPQTYTGPDSPNASVSGSCVDHAGNTSVGSFALSYDATAPLAYGAPARDPDSNGWYNQPLRVAFDGTDATSGIGSCTAPTVYSGPDDADASLTGACSDRAGNTSALSTFSLGYDASPPQVAAAPARPPDANGWYNHPLTVDFTGNDATSGIESCGRVTYSGPDAATAFVGGSCRDRAGNQGAVSIVVKYDATAPAITLLVAKAGKRSAKLIWRTTPDTQKVELTRSPGSAGEDESVVFQGAGSTSSFLDAGLRAGRSYHYRLQAADEAANEATRPLEFVGRGALLYPGPGERVSKPPLLVWSAVRGAKYYNVVLVRGRRVFSAWPVRARLQLPRSWTYHGRRYKLRAGAYRWYVWPGRGRLAAGRYGKLLGGSSFVVSR
jgi:hypothetical protein